MRGVLPYPAFGSEQTWIPQPDDYTVVQAAAAAITLPDVGYRLVRVLVNSGATPGYLTIAYDGIAKAWFPAYSNATLGAQAWALTWAFKGLTLPANLFTFGANVTGVTYTFSKGASKGPMIEAYRAVGAEQATANVGTTKTATTASPLTYDVGPATPDWIMSFATVANVNLFWPAIGTGQGGAPADAQPSAVGIHMAPTLPKATSLSLTYTALAVGAMTYVVGYTPSMK
jgi:hypothetical protein